MARINVYYTDGDGTTRTGWFDTDAATENTSEYKDWNGSNHIGRMSGLQAGYEEIYRTAGGRWVRHYNGRNEYNGPEYYEFITDEQARDWLIRDGDDDIVEKWFGELEPERGPGRPEVGKPINVRLGDELLGRVDAWAEKLGKSRADILRELVEAGLAARTPAA